MRLQLEHHLTLLRDFLDSVREIAAEVNIDFAEIDEEAEDIASAAESYAADLVKEAKSNAHSAYGDCEAARKDLYPTLCLHHFLGEPCPSA